MTVRSKAPQYANRYAKMHRHGVRLTVDATVVRRMIRALNAIGYTNGEISAEAGVGCPSYVGNLTRGSAGGGPRTKVQLKTAQRIEAYYQEHHDKPRLSRPGNKRAATFARKRRYPPPAAWDDINDLSEKPKGVVRK